MTDADAGGTPRSRAIARVQDLLEKPLEQPVAAGYVIGIDVGAIVDAVAAELGDAALRLPRYYPKDEGKRWLLGTARRIGEDGEPPTVHAVWKTGLPNGRIWVQILEGNLDLAEFIASPDSLPHVLRALLAGCEHSAAAVVGDDTAGDAGDEAPAGDGAE